MEELHSDFDFLVSHNGGEWIPCEVRLDHVKNKYSKVRAKWLTDGSNKGYGICKHIMLPTGDKTGLFVVDIDKLNPDRADHDGKIDGIQFFEDWCGPVLAPDTLTIRTIGGGYHKVYKYTDSMVIKSGYIDHRALVEILWNGCTRAYGEGYNIIHKIPPAVPSYKIKAFITINNHITINNNFAVPTIEKQFNHDINKVIGTNCRWKVVKHDDVYKLTPMTNQCCVESDYIHSENEHSCIYVRKQLIVLSCFRHGKKVIRGDKSKPLRELFFKCDSKGVMAAIVDDIVLNAESNGLVRENGCVFKRAHDGFKLVSTYEEFLIASLKDNAALIERPRRFNELMIYMEKVDSSLFPFVKRDKRYIGFSNGILDIIDGKLVSSDILKQNIVPRHYINQPFDAHDLDTPMFDRIVKYQLEDDELYTYMLAFIGRLFYDVGEFDKFDVMPFIIGDTKTGKSTLTDIICAMFSSSSIGVIDSNHESIFGLQTKCDKELLIATEISDRMANQLSSDTFKRMVCGEIVNVAIKHAKSNSVQWKVPMFMCGNQHLNYHDERGSISRRLAIFKFEKFVHEVDTSIKSSVINNELSKITAKCLLAYRMLLDYAGTGEFWSKCPDYFKDNIDDMNYSTDYIYRFLSLGPEDNEWGGRQMYFIKSHDSIIHMEDFKTKFFNWLRFKHQNAKYKWTSDYSAFKRKGFDVVRTKVCKDCKGESKKNCCERYDPDNRWTRTVIKNIACIDTGLYQ